MPTHRFLATLMFLSATLAGASACGGRTPTDEYLETDPAGGGRSGGTGGRTITIGGTNGGGTGGVVGPIGGFQGGGARCAVYDFANIVPNSIRGTTVGEEDHAFAYCGAVPGSPDAPVTFTAPVAGNYVFDTVGSYMDTVLSVYDGYCNFLTPLDCNDDSMYDVQSRAVVQLATGQGVTAVVDGFGGIVGDFVLNVSLAEGDPGCPDTTITTATTVYGSTYGQRVGYDVSCTDIHPSPTYSVVFIPDIGGTYTIDTFGSNYDTVLAVLQGTCGGTELGCNDDASFGVQSRVTVTLAIGVPVTILVSGYYGDTGSFMLNISR
jgi:hypothetical protein